MMKTSVKPWSAALLAAVSLGTFWSTSRAQTYTEVGDAGDTLATAQSTISSSNPAGTAITSISGSIGTGTDADLYAVQINAPTTFSATTNNAVTNASFISSGHALPLDTSLFLFNSAGVEVATNDDTNGTTVTSTLAAGNPLYASLAPGLYYIGISISGNEPVNSAGQLLFALSDDPTDVRGPETSNNIAPMTLSTFDQDNYDNESGSYAITLNGVTAAPEPSAWALTALGGVAVAYLSGRRKKNRV